MPDEELEDGSIIVDWADPDRVDALLRQLRAPGAQYGLSGDTIDHAIWTIEALLRQVNNAR